MGKIFVLDTNVLLHSAKSIESFEDNTVVIPMPVIEELDKFKRNQDELGRNARQVIRKIDNLREKAAASPGSPKLSDGIELGNASNGKQSGKLMVLQDDGFMIPGVKDPTYADNRILSIAYELSRKRGDKDVVWVISKDLNLRLRADALGLAVDDFKKQKIKFDELFTGSTQIDASSETIDEFYNRKPLEPPADRVCCPNEFIVMRDPASGKSAVGIMKNGQIRQPVSLHGDKVWNVTPRSNEQRMALQLLMDPEIQVVTLVGQAGSGKTFLALAAALALVKHEKAYDKILISRPIVPMGNDIGYLPGDKDEKLSVWMQPVYDNLTVLLRDEKARDDTSARRQIEEMRRSSLLEMEALTYIRGRSIPNQLVIIDEAQNLTPHEVKTIISRAGENTKMILTGDPEQIDNPYLDASSNGLTYTVERFKSLQLHGHITLKKSVRSKLAAAAAEYL